MSMTYRKLLLLLTLGSLTSCGLLGPSVDATQDTLFGRANEPTIDHRAAARAAAGQALIQKGLDTPDPAVAERWINMGVGLMD